MSATQELKAMLEKAGRIINDLNQLTLDQEHYAARLSKEIDDLKVQLEDSRSRPRDTAKLGDPMTRIAAACEALVEKFGNIEDSVNSVARRIGEEPIR